MAEEHGVILADDIRVLWLFLFTLPFWVPPYVVWATISIRRSLRRERLPRKIEELESWHDRYPTGQALAERSVEYVELECKESERPRWRDNCECGMPLCATPGHKEIDPIDHILSVPSFEEQMAAAQAKALADTYRVSHVEDMVVETWRDVRGQKVYRQMTQEEWARTSPFETPTMEMRR